MLGKRDFTFFQIFLSLWITCINEKFYHDEIYLLFISSVVKKKVRNIVQDSNFLSIMNNESTNNSIIGHLMSFVTSIEKGLPMAIFLGLLEIIDGKKMFLIFLNVSCPT